MFVVCFFCFFWGGVTLILTEALLSVWSTLFDLMMMLRLLLLLMPTVRRPVSVHA